MNTFYVVEDDTVIKGIPVITMGGELDFAASPELRERIFAQIEEGRRRMLLDFTSVSFIDSTAIGVIAGAIARLRGSGGGAIAIVCPEDGHVDHVRDIFHITGLDAGVLLYGSREEGIAELSQGR